MFLRIPSTLCHGLIYKKDTEVRERLSFSTLETIVQDQKRNEMTVPCESEEIKKNTVRIHVQENPNPKEK